MRRGAARPRRSDQAAAGWWGSSLACWRWPHRRAVMVAERRMRCPPTGTRFGVQQVVGSSWRPRCPDACRGLVALSASSVSVHASGVRCPVSARAMSARPVSNVRVSGCPLSGVSSIGVRAFRVPVRVRCVRTGDFVERVGGQPHGQGHGLAALPYPRTARATARARAEASAPAQAVLGQRRRRLDLVVVVEALGQRTGFDRMAGQGPPVEQDRPSVWEQVCALCTPSCGMAAHRPSGAGLAA
jgi:hypothetical protein